MKTLDILTAIKETKQVTEQQINLLKRRLNNGEKIDIQWIWDNCPQLTNEQDKKGIKYLLNLLRTPAGKERKNNPFGFREIEALETFEYFELAGFYDCSRSGQKSFFIPIYNVVGEKMCFQYHMFGGKINIVG